MIEEYPEEYPENKIKNQRYLFMENRDKMEEDMNREKYKPRKLPNKF